MAAHLPKAIVVCAALFAASFTPPVYSQTQAPAARLIPADPITFPSLADSNSPAVWEVIDGRPKLFVINSEAGKPFLSAGDDMSRLVDPVQVSFHTPPSAGIWFESVVPDVDGTWYGFYHNELPAMECDEDPRRMIPRIGAARSRDFGTTWEDLGVILEAPRDTFDCTSVNTYFVGGVGDFTVILDQTSSYLYLFFSQYWNRDERQGVAVARMPWADRDDPSGKMAVWHGNGAWTPPRAVGPRRRYVYPPGRPIYRATDEWHRDESVDAYWGPSVHWNTHLRQYVMLLNRARTSTWEQEGIYVAFARQLDNPRSWSTPQQVISGGPWYPQVLGMEVGTGTDRIAGRRARLFQGGQSHYVIEFVR